MAYTDSELTQYFPVDTTADLLQTIAQVDYLTQDGVISDNDLRQLLPIIGTAMDVNIEQTTPQSATYTGTAGSTNRSYYSVPCYPLPTGGAQNAGGKYINQLPQDPPQGRQQAPGLQKVDAELNRYVGGSQAVPPTPVVVDNTAGNLDQSNYVTVVAPASGASVIAGVTYDIYCAAVTSGVTSTYLVETGVAPGATVLDKLEFRSGSYTLPAHTQYAVDKSGSSPVPIPAPRTFLA